jgi:hypothetical protein
MERPDRLIDFALVVVGSPALPPFDLWGARVLGAVGVVAMAALLVDAARRRQAYTGLPAFLLAQAIFSSLTIALIAAWRSPLGIEAAEAPRYCMPAASLWTALVILAWHAAPGFRMPSVVERFGLAMAAVLIVLATVSPWQAVPPWEPVFNDLDQTEDAIRVGVYDDSAIVRIYAAPDDIKPFIPILDEYDISIFYRDELAKLIGTPLAETFGTAQGLCSGSFDATLDARSPAGAAVSGWAWDPNRTQRPPTVLIVGPDGIIRGLATAATDRVDVIASVPGVTTVATGWFGYSRPTEGPARAYAVVADGVVCPLNGEHEVVASFS